MEISKIYLCATESQNIWHLDSGCSKHMTGESSKFIILKDNKGKVTFGDSLSSKIIGKGTIVVNSKIKAENVLLVENLKPNILSVIQTCDQGHICIFDSEKNVKSRIRNHERLLEFLLEIQTTYTSWKMKTKAI